MSLSLRDQLLAAGLGSKKQAKQIEQDQRRDTRRHQDAAAAEQKRAAAHAQAQAAKAARDQELNRKRQQEAELRARRAEIKQLIQQNLVQRAETDEVFHFVDGKKIRRLYANAELREQIIGGAVNIVRSEGRYFPVPAEIGARIAEREPNAVVKLNQKAEEASAAPAEDDPYKDFVVPDDLKW
jgi:uncharacterized protein